MKKVEITAYGAPETVASGGALCLIGALVYSVGRLPASTETSSPEPASPGYGAYLGTVPDMTDSPGGVRLVGVRAGSPAERAGLRGDDVITRIGTMEVPNLAAMWAALRSHQPGDVVEIVVRRGNQVTTLRATLGIRGG